LQNDQAPVGVDHEIGRITQESSRGQEALRTRLGVYSNQTTFVEASSERVIDNDDVPRVFDDDAEWIEQESTAAQEVLLSGVSVDGDDPSVRNVLSGSGIGNDEVAGFEAGRGPRDCETEADEQDERREVGSEESREP
jgi:hypothetical protein